MSTRTDILATRRLIPVFALGLLLPAVTSQAGVVTFNYTVEYTGGASPVGDPPWVRATFTDLGPGAVSLLLEAVDLSATEFVSRWYFNVDPTLDPEALAIDYQSGTLPSSVAAGADDFNQGGARFDLSFGFPTANGPGRFGEGDSSLFHIMNSAPTFGAQSFAVLSAGNRSLLASAHVQGIGAGVDDSGWLEPGEPIPEPGTLLLIGSGLLGLAARRRSARP